MPRIGKEIDMDQLSLFDSVISGSPSSSSKRDVPSELAVDASVRELLVEAIKRTNLSRDQIAQGMSRTLGTPISKSQLDCWTSPGKDGYRFPLSYLASFSRVTGDTSVIRFICSKLGGGFINKEDAVLLQLARIERDKRELSRKERVLRGALEINQ